VPSREGTLAHIAVVISEDYYILVMLFFAGSIARNAIAGILVSQRPILRFFAVQGRHVASMGVKFGMKEWV